MYVALYLKEVRYSYMHIMSQNKSLPFLLIKLIEYPFISTQFWLHWRKLMILMKTCKYSYKVQLVSIFPLRCEMHTTSCERHAEQNEKY